MLRFWLSTSVHTFVGRGFPFGTLVVNVVGCLLMGMLFVLLVERTSSDAVWRAFLLVGILGGFTTFSAFSMETIHLIEEGGYLRALANVAASLILCLGATWIGAVIGRQI